MEYHNKMLKNAEIENIFEDEFTDSNQQIKEISPTCNILSSSSTDDEEKFLNAMKEQWWFNIFDPNNSQFDVSLNMKRISILFLLILA
jgi:hypothetical protein